MISRISFRHFKCFRRLGLPLEQLTLLSGGNASGKSTVIQALVLLNQTMREQEWSTRLLLNGGGMRLGTAADVIDKEHGRRSFGVEITHDAHSVRWQFVGDREELAMRVSRVSIDGVETLDPEPLRHLLPLDHGDSPFVKALRGLTYLSAERMGPKETYPLLHPSNAPVVGSKGEHAVSVLFAKSQSEVNRELVLKGAPPTLLRQVEARMASFFPGCGFTIEKVARVNAATLGLRNSPTTDFHQPIHTGFGLTQLFPVVVAALAAGKDDLLLIENPEVHLHPAGQAAIGRFLAEVAAAGVQVVVETHSDHVLNGIRRTVKDGVVSPDQVALHFFRPRQADGLPQVESPCVHGDGSIDSWPDGFFDQFDRDVNHLVDWG